MTRCLEIEEATALEPGELPPDHLAECEKCAALVEDVEPGAAGDVVEWRREMHGAAGFYVPASGAQAKRQTKTPPSAC